MVIIGQDQENRNSKLNPYAIPKRNYDANKVDDDREILNHNGSVGSGILDYMIKISVVIMVCSIFQSIWIVFAILNYVEIHYYDDHGDDYLHFFAIISRHLCVMINCLVWYLVPVFNSYQYLKYCRLCDLAMRHGCVKCVVRKTIQNKFGDESGDTY